MAASTRKIAWLVVVCMCGWERRRRGEGEEEGGGGEEEEGGGGEEEEGGRGKDKIEIFTTDQVAVTDKKMDIILLQILMAYHCVQ